MSVNCEDCRGIGRSPRQLTPRTCDTCGGLGRVGWDLQRVLEILCSVPRGDKDRSGYEVVVTVPADVRAWLTISKVKVGDPIRLKALTWWRNGTVTSKIMAVQAWGHDNETTNGWMDPDDHESWESFLGMMIVRDE